MHCETISYEQFKVDMVEKLHMTLGNVGELSVFPIYKLNGEIREGISLKRTGSNISPTLCLNHIYTMYRNGVTMEQLLENFRTTFMEREIPEALMEIDYRDYSQVCGHIAMRLISRDRNEQLLREIPYRIFYDLAVVYYLMLEDEEGNMLSLTITDGLMRMWDVEEPELYFRALVNAPYINPHILFDMPDMLSMLTQQEKQYSQKEMPIYVLSNEKNCYGASEILVPGTLEEAQEKIGGDFWILPSSVHEVLLVPGQSGFDVQTLESMVYDINRTCLEPEIILGDHVYYYSTVTGLHGEFYHS